MAKAKQIQSVRWVFVSGYPGVSGVFTKRPAIAGAYDVSGVTFASKNNNVFIRGEVVRPLFWAKSAQNKAYDGSVGNRSFFHHANQQISRLLCVQNEGFGVCGVVKVVDRAALPCESADICVAVDPGADLSVGPVCQERARCVFVLWLVGPNLEPYTHAN
ncbi:hypothetical protein Bbelb_104890 [Branchiostoma belcheri]|nr:hypothetical protein Bbelb_104890 [Branchiostoma belcheri]